MSTKYLRVFLFLLACVLCQSVLARSEFLDAWDAKYPQAAETTGTADCHICHRDNPGNNSGGWNAYGWEIRTLTRDGFSLDFALDIAGVLNPDNDPAGQLSNNEINQGALPGWTEGANNAIFKADGMHEFNQLPPVLSNTANARYDLPPAISDPISQTIVQGDLEVVLETVAEGFQAPLHAARAPGVNGKLFVVEQTGKIIEVDLSTGNKTTFYDVSADLVTLSTNFDERGLIGLVFHPNYASNGLFYTHQSEPVRMGESADFTTLDAMEIANHRSKVVEYLVTNPLSNPVVIKNREVLVVDQPQFNHNGGMLEFGADGFLYIGIGDGGGVSGDVDTDTVIGHGDFGNGRDNTNPLGTILRIDPLGNNSGNGEYGIPPTNPFAAMGDAGLDEIYAYGFRNPYRFSFDASNGALIAADVGQSNIEEINVVTSGANYGWNHKEGSFFFIVSRDAPGDPDTTTYISNEGIVPPGLTDPIAEYDHDEGISVTGGYVYRGADIKSLQGRYVFADWNKRLFYLDSSNQIKQLKTDVAVDFVTGFAQDHDNELYVITNSTFAPTGAGGKLLKINDVPDDGFCFPIKANNGAMAVVCL